MGQAVPVVRLPVVVVAAMLGSIVVGSPAPAGQPTKRLATVGRLGVGVRTETFVDDTRPTAAHNGEPQIATRTLVTTVLYPARKVSGGDPNPGAAPARGKFPLVVFAGGASSGPGTFVPYLSQWVRAGYVIAAPKFPLTGENTPGGPLPDDYVNEPADLGVVIAGLVRLAHDKHSLYSKLVDGRRVAAVGASLGGAAVMALGYNDCCIDARVHAIVSISGAENLPGLTSFPGTYTFPPTPLLLVRGSNTLDPLATFSDAIYANARGSRTLLTITNGGHVPIIPLTDTGAQTAMRAVPAFLDAHLKGRTTTLRAFLDTLTDPTVATVQK
jgi:hypothetical protein